MILRLRQPLASSSRCTMLLKNMTMKSLTLTTNATSNDIINATTNNATNPNHLRRSNTTSFCRTYHVATATVETDSSKLLLNSLLLQQQQQQQQQQQNVILVASTNNDDDNESNDNDGNNENDDTPIVNDEDGINDENNDDEIPTTEETPSEENILSIQLRPSEVVSSLNAHIVGQNDAKRAVAIAMRNRWRRRQLPKELMKEVTPRNVLMIGPTGCG